MRTIEDFWENEANRLTWFKPFQRVRSGDFKQVNFKWFEGGKLNAAYNCIDRHLETRANEVALIWAKDELGEYERITYQELFNQVGRLANTLRSLGVQKGDRVCIYLPMVPEAVYSILACARIGAVHSVVFAGFSAESLRDRIVDAGCKVVLTADEGLRGGKKIPLKAITDEALQKAGAANPVQTVLVHKRTGGAIAMQKGRDLWMDEEMKSKAAVCPAEVMDAEDPLFILYTSGSTGKPKGLLHTTGGYLFYASYTQEKVFDYRPGQIHFCAADVGWVTGHSYVVYGPLSNGGTTVIFESVPTYPDAGRYWKIIEDLKVDIFYTAPTALRALHQKGDSFVTRYDRSSLKILGSVGEPINPEIWKWYDEVVGEKRCAVVDTWWQTETGGVLISPIPGASRPKPGSATLPLPGIVPVIVDPSTGKKVEETIASGALCLADSWPGQARTIWGDHERFKQTYFTQYPGLYFTGDGCNRDEDGYFWITGRIDDVINVSGHRLGTAEIESALVENSHVAEAAVVGCPHEIKGTGIYCYVLLKDEFKSKLNTPEMVAELKNQVGHSIGKFATPDVIHTTTSLPKTRSGKIMRRILRKIAAGEYEGMGDISTLAEPDVVQKLIHENQQLMKGQRREESH